MNFANIEGVTEGEKVLEQEWDRIKQREYRAPFCPGKDTAHVFAVNINVGCGPWPNDAAGHQMPRDPLYSFGKYLSGTLPPHLQWALNASSAKDKMRWNP